MALLAALALTGPAALTPVAVQAGGAPGANAVQVGTRVARDVLARELGRH